jgi:hypothetical protein
MIQIQEQIYQITWAFNTLNEEDLKRVHPEDLWDDLWTDRLVYETALFKEQNGVDFQRLLNRNQEFKGLPDKIVMFGWFDLLQKTELPTNNISWTIVSKKILGVVKQLGFADYRLIPIRVIDRTPFKYPADEDIRTYENDLLMQDLKYDDDLFYGFQVLPRVKLLTDDSDFFENKVIWRDDINLLELPNFFREVQRPGELLVNQEARDALESAGIRGIRFTEPFSL